MNFSRLDVFLNFVVKLPWSCFIRNQYAGGRFYGKENESAFSGSFCRPRIVLGGGALISPQTTFAAEVTISDPSDARLNQAELAGGASTGPGDNTPIVGNVLTFKNVSFMGTGYYTGIGYGGRNFAGTVVERNRIHVDGAQVKIAVGGSGLNGAVRDNTALVYNLSKVQTAKGGEAKGSGQENTASGNHLGVVSSVVQSGYGGLSTYGTAEKNTVEISGGAFMQNVYGGSGGFSSPLATIRENSVTIENATFQDLGAQFPGSGDHTKEIAGGVVQSIVGGIGSTISENSVTIKSGTISVPVYGGKSYNGATVTKNKVVLTGGTYTDLIYGGDAHTEASENEVHLTNVTVPAVFGGSAAIANNNKIYLNGGVTVTQSIVGGDGTTSTGNTLTVKGVNTVQDRIKEVQKYAFDIAGVASTANPLLTVGGAVQTDMDWTQLSVTGTPAASLLNQTITLMRQSGSDIAFGSTYNGKKVATDDGVEHIVDTDTQAPTAHEITSTSYAFKGQTAPSQIGTDTWGGRSVGGNSTRENTIELSSGTHTDVYGGWTTGTGTTAEDKDASYKNIVTIKSGATVTGDVYGGSAANGAAHDNTVHIDGTTIGGAVIGGRGSTATNNTVQLTNAAVGGTVTGGMVGTAAGGTDNTLRVKGNSTAAQMNGFQKFHFDLAGANTATPMLGITGTARTWLDWAQLTTDGSGAGVTLLSNPHGLDVANYTGAITTTTDTTERNIDTDTHSDTGVTSIRAESYQFAGVTAPVTLTGDANGYGGISRAGNSTRNNAVELTSGNYADFYGGHTSGAGTTQTDKNDSHDNTVTVKSGVTVTNVYGGFAANGTATKNTVHIDGAHVAGRVVGGRGTTANDNTVQLTNASIGGVVVGGLASEANGASGNTLVVKGNNTAYQIEGFQKYRFDLTGANAATPMLSLASGGGTGIDWAQLSVEGSGTGITLLHNAGGLVLANYTGAITTTTDTTERNIDTDTHSDTGVTSIRAESYQFAGVTAPVTLAGDANGYGGISRAGNSTRNNAVELTSGSYADFYGGHTSGAGTTQTDKNDSHDNTVTVKSGVTVTNVYGGFAANGAATKNTVHIDGGSPLGDVIGGRGSTATNNTVTVTSGSAAAVIGGQSSGDATGNVVTLGGNFTGNLTGAVSTTGAASHNTLDLGTFDLAGNVTGGSGTAAQGNVIALRGTHVTGTVTGGRVGGTAGGVNNTLAVYYNAARSSEIGDFAGVQNLHFYLGDAAANTAPTLLKLTNAGGDKDVSGLKIRVGRSGAAAKLQKGDTFTLMENAAGNITGDAARVTGEGMDGVSRLYRFAVAPDEANRNKLIATVTSVGFAEQAKSFVETRAGAAAFLGSGGDFLVETALPSAQKEAARQGAADGGSYALWAGMGGNAMKYKTGSHVDMKGWSLGVGWARPLAVAEGTLTFGPFVEYGRGSYDSYLDDGTHADGTASYLGLGVMAKLKTTDGTWAEASMRLGRTKSDYAGVLDGTAASYDSASSYYAGHLGIGKELRLREKDTLNVYLRYFHAHTGAADETISTGERYHFDAVNSHRTRLGLRWTQELKDAAQLYAGLAWEYEFGGDARASYDGEGTPTPTLKGSSALLELGYRFAPKASRVNYDLHLTGWQGKRQGVTGGASVNWMF